MSIDRHHLYAQGRHSPVGPLSARAGFWFFGIAAAQEWAQRHRRVGSANGQGAADARQLGIDAGS
jgi:hypothetical protein